MAETARVETRKKKKRLVEGEELVSGDDPHDGEEESVVPPLEKGKKRKRNVEEEERSELLQDPLVVFGQDIMLMILSRLDAQSVALSLLVCHAWHAIASSDRIWSSKLEELWRRKAHIPRPSQVRGISKLAAYSLSVLDAKRTRIMKDDLCDHVWEFRFTKAAPEYWRNLDPSWIGSGLLCAASSTQMAPRLQILVTRCGVVMSVLI